MNSFNRFRLGLAGLFQVLLLLPAISQPAVAQTTYTPYLFTTIAGTPGVAGSADGMARSPQFWGATGVAVDPSGNVYVADTDNNAVRKISSAGVVTTLVANPGFWQPSGVAVDASGNVYVADTGTRTIRKIDSYGVVTVLAGTLYGPGSADGTGPAARFRMPVGVAVDGAGNVYVADGADSPYPQYTSNTIRKITPAGVVTTLAGTAGVWGSSDGTGPAAQFSSPAGVAVDTAGNVYVADSFNCTIRKITPSGVVTTLAGSAGTAGSADGTGPAARFNSPTGVTVDAAANIYVADGANYTIRKVTAAGSVTTLAGSARFQGSVDGTGAAANFAGPNGVAVDAEGNIYVGDGYTIRKVTAAGLVTTLAGTAGAAGNRDGAEPAAQFHNPDALALDASGDIIVADVTIRKITPDGVVTTLAGTAGVSGYADGTGPAAQFNGLSGIAVDATGDIYVADSGNCTIRKVTSTGAVTTLAGSAGNQGTLDGTGPAARFTSLRGLAVDASGYIYVADPGFGVLPVNTIRRITPGGSVTTLAGTPGVTGSKDGTGSAAQFNKPEGVAVDGGGNVFVADTGNNTIRKITSAGVVTTIAGTAGVTGNFDGIGLTAQFNGPSRVAVDATGNVYVADAGNDEVRRIAAGGVVTTLAGGSPYYIGFGDGVGASVWFHFLNGIATDPSGNVFVATTNQTIMEGVPAMAPTVTLSPAASTVASGRSVVFNAVGTGLPAPTYQWTLNGSGNIPGAAVTTDRVLLVSGTTAADAGTYACTVTNGAGSASASGTLTVTSTPTPGYLTNLSARANVGTGANILIAGFGVGGSGSTDLLLRGVGPGLATISTLTGILSNPALTLFDSAPVPGPYPIVTGQGWGGGLAQGTSSIDIGQQPATANLMASVGAFTLSAGSADSAMEVTPPAGNYTAQISGVGNTVGVALAEIYDVDGVPLTARLVNVSARAGVGTGNNVLIGGFSIAGATSETVLIRAVGPGLAGLGVPGILIQPTLTIYSGATPIYANTVWAGDPIVAAIFPVVGAFSLNTASSDSVLLLTLAPGNYTAQVTGVNNGTGIALVEIYEVF